MASVLGSTRDVEVLLEARVSRYSRPLLAKVSWRGCLGSEVLLIKSWIEEMGDPLTEANISPGESISKRLASGTSNKVRELLLLGSAGNSGSCFLL